MSGSLSSLSIAGIISGSTSFAVTASSPTLTLPGDSGPETASLLQLTLTNLQLSVGTATVGVQISGGEIQVADVTSSTSNKSFLAVLATGLTATLTVPELTASRERRPGRRSTSGRPAQATRSTGRAPSRP